MTIAANWGPIRALFRVLATAPYPLEWPETNGRRPVTPSSTPPSH